MIDVLLVLLVFFVMITSAEVLKVDKGLTLPISPNAKAKEKEMARHEIAVNLRWDPTTSKSILTMNEREYPVWADFTPALKKELERDKELRVVVRGDKLLPAGEIQKIMNQIGEAGVADIAFAASNK